MSLPATLAVILLLGAWLALWTRLARVPIRRLQYRGPTSVMLGTTVVYLSTMLGGAFSSACSYAFGTASLAAVLALPAGLAWPMVARRRR